MMIEIPMWLWVVWIALPVVLIAAAYLMVIGWKSPSKIIRVYSDDNNRIDKDGGPYEVMIRD